MNQLNKDEVEVHFAVLDEMGEINEKELQRATTEILEGQCTSILNYDRHEVDEDEVEIEMKLAKFVLDNTTQSEDGRLTMPLMWNGKVSHLLGENFNLSIQILNSNFKRLSKNKERLMMVDKVFKEQEELGIIERIDNLNHFREEHPQHSFLPHMPVFKPEKDTTKCRVVYLSNLCEKDKSKSMTICHNQAIHPGPNLNKKLSSSLLLLRFDKNLICFDIKKAFLQIALKEVDQNRLLFLWYKNVEKKDYAVIGFKSKRLPFGITCSPSILILALYKILILDGENDPDQIKELKQLIYDLIYVDNGAYTTNDPHKLIWAYKTLNTIFEPYQFSLQQFVTNNSTLQNEIDKLNEEKTSGCVKLFGLQWDRLTDTLSTKQVHLDGKANTKRLVLKTLAQNFDLFYFNGPILNRARLFMHDLQTDKSLGWDSILSNDQIHEWKNISKQVSATPEIKLKRFIGKRNGHYRLICFTDASKLIYGIVNFIQDLDTMEVSFILAKNRLVNKQLETKGIPSLEFQAIILGTETLINIYKDLAGKNCVIPIKIEELQLYTDNMVSLNWINSHVHKLDKMQQKSIFIRNRLNNLSKLCETFPIHYSFVSGFENPADMISRAVSYKQLMKTNYFTGPTFLKGEPNSKICRDDILNIRVPNPQARSDLEMYESNQFSAAIEIQNKSLEHLIPLDKYSSFHKLVSVHKCVLKFINNLKVKLKTGNPDRYKHFSCDNEDGNFFVKAYKQIILQDQMIHFDETFKYFKCRKSNVKDIPNIVNQLNVFPDREGLLRVNNKCSKGKFKNRCYFPILRSKTSQLSKLIIIDLHKKLAHVGRYTLLSELRKKFWVPQYYSLVKNILKKCIICKRFNERTIKLNQSPYKDFRINPPNIPYKYLFLDYIGPYNIKWMGKKVKIWILCITCMWSRAINLKICMDLTVKNFLRAFQMHTFEYGIPELVLSDLGSQIVAGSNIIHDFIKDAETQIFLQENNVKNITFEQYFKGNSALGSLVESCVKLTKRLLYGSIGNNVLEFLDFEFLIAETVHIVNKRPIAFKETLRNSDSLETPDPITPEMLLKGYNLVSINVIPALQIDPEPDPSWDLDQVDRTVDCYKKLKKVRERLIDIYNNEFIVGLISQATNSKSRYKPVFHKSLQIGDIVLLKEKHLKPNNFPMAIVKELQTNINNEVTGAIVLKGKTRELVKRHTSSIIPLLTVAKLENHDSIATNKNEVSIEVDRPLIEHNVRSVEKENSKKRKAALKSDELNRNLLNRGLV